MASGNIRAQILENSLSYCSLQPYRSTITTLHESVSSKYIKKSIDSNNQPIKEQKPIYVTAWKTDRELIIPNGDQSLKASVGDYIVKQPDGTFNPVNPDIFEQTYDRCDE